MYVCLPGRHRRFGTPSVSLAGSRADHCLTLTVTRGQCPRWCRINGGGANDWSLHPVSDTATACSHILADMRHAIAWRAMNAQHNSANKLNELDHVTSNDNQSLVFIVMLIHIRHSTLHLIIPCSALSWLGDSIGHWDCT